MIFVSSDSVLDLNYYFLSLTLYKATHMYLFHINVQQIHFSVNVLKKNYIISIVHKSSGFHLREKNFFKTLIYMYNTEQVCKGSAFLFVCKDPAGLLEQSNYGNHRLVNIQNFRLVNMQSIYPKKAYLLV